MKQYMGTIIVCVGILIVAGGAFSLLSSQGGDADEWEATVVESYPHDELAFTQGLMFHKGELFESTGRKGESTIRKLELGKATPVQIKKIDDELFGEGIVCIDDRLIQLTWQDEVVLEFDLATFKETNRRSYDGEGWGLTYDGKHLIISDGSDILRFVDPDTFEVDRTISVTLNGLPLKKLNEVEYVDGLIYANVWYKDYIVAIAPNSGEVKRRIDCSAIVKQEGPTTRDAALNGIAYNPDTKEWFLTGKLWSHIYRVEFSRKSR